MTPTGTDPTVPIASSGTTTINLAHYVSSGQATTLTATASVPTGARWSRAQRYFGPGRRLTSLLKAGLTGFCRRLGATLPAGEGARKR